MLIRLRRKRNLWYLLMAIILLTGVFTWQSDLTSDPPMYFSGIGQSLSTDPPLYSLHARNMIQYGELNPVGDYRWVVMQYSIVSLASYVWLSIAGISLNSVNMIGVFFSLGGLLLLLLALARHHRPWVLNIVAVCYLINVSLFTHGRLTYLENGLIFLAALLMFIYSRWGDRSWGLILCGCTVALATLTGKLFGVFLLPALIASIFITGSEHRWRRATIATAGFVSTCLLLLTVLYGNESSMAFSFFGEQSVGLHGFPAGLTSPWGFVEHFASYGFPNRLYYLNPDLLVMFLAGAILLVLMHTGHIVRLRQLSPPAVLMFFWVSALILALMPLNYSPLRYSVAMIPAIIAFTFTMLDHAYSAKSLQPLRPSRMALVVAGLGGWMILFHLVANFYVPDSSIRLVVWATLPGGVGVAVLFWYVFRQHRIILNRRLILACIVGILVVSIGVNSFRLRRYHVLDNCFTLTEANHDLPYIVGPDAVLAGHYAPALTVENNRKSIIQFFFEAAKTDSTFFLRYPVTHLVLEESNWRNAVKIFSELANIKPIATYWIRDYQVNIYNVSRLFGNPVAMAYEETPYEKAVALTHIGQDDSALAILQPIISLTGTSKAVGLLYSDIMTRKMAHEQVSTVLTALAYHYPTDFSIQLTCGNYLQRVALIRHDRSLLARAEEYFARAVKYNRYRAQHARGLWQQNLRQMSGSISQVNPELSLLQ